jgi:hypothetical protein
VNARTAGLGGARRRRTADGKYPDAASGAIVHIAETGHACEVPAATALHAIGIAGPGLSINTSCIEGSGIWAAATNAPHALSVRTTALAIYPGAVTLGVAEALHTRGVPAAKASYADSVRTMALAIYPDAVALGVAEARHTREIPAAKASHAVGVARASLAENARTRRSPLPDDTYGGNSPSLSGTIYSSILTPDCAWRLVKNGAAGDPDDTGAGLPAAPSSDTISMEISLANYGV